MTYLKAGGHWGKCKFELGTREKNLPARDPEEEGEKQQREAAWIQKPLRENEMMKQERHAFINKEYPSTLSKSHIYKAG